jgi:hypothetical protein
MPHFTLFFKTATLRNRLVPCLAEIPACFSFYLQTGTPPNIVISETDPLWQGFPFPVHAGDVYIFDDEIPARALGGACAMRAAIRVRPEDDDEVLLLRLWHELLHAVGQPADDMIPMAATWQTPLDRLIWWLWPHFCGSRDVPYWHRRFYHYLTARAALGGVV